MTGSGCAAVRHDFAVYLFGALSPAERAIVDRHLAWCHPCREELAMLAGLPALLQRVPAAQASRICAEQTAAEGPDHFAADGLLNMMLSRTAGVRRHQRWRLAAAALLLITVAAAGWGPRILHHAQRSAPPGHWWTATAEGSGPATHAGARVRYAARPWGTQLQVHVTGIPIGTTCQLRVTGSQGQTVEAGGWVIARGQQAIWYPASAPVHPASLHGFEVTSAGKALVTVQAHRLSPATRCQTLAATGRSSTGGPGYPDRIYKTLGQCDPALAFPLPHGRDDADERRQANRAVAVSAAGLGATGLAELLLAVLTDSVGV